MKTSNAALDRADELAEAERESGIKSARRALSRKGPPDCIECGKPIGERRRKVLPSATRCYLCQEAHEEEQAGR
jgi:phage/conjugal plasmid C-4 type zinc finger TraR family protein